MGSAPSGQGKALRSPVQVEAIRPFLKDGGTKFLQTTSSDAVGGEDATHGCRLLRPLPAPLDLQSLGGITVGRTEGNRSSMAPWDRSLGVLSHSLHSVHTPSVRGFSGGYFSLGDRIHQSPLLPLQALKPGGLEGRTAVALATVVRKGETNLQGREATPPFVQTRVRPPPV